jgi:hypothetical protein
MIDQHHDHVWAGGFGLLRPHNAGVRNVGADVIVQAASGLSAAELNFAGRNVRGDWKVDYISLLPYGGCGEGERGC